MNRSGVSATPAAGTLESHAPRQTREIGRAIGAAALPGTLLALIGPLGAGKTELAKGVAEGLGVTTVVNSPTFVLMNEHDGRLRLFHVDAYRLEDPDEAFAAGLLDDRAAAGLTVVEWADRLAAQLPAERLELTIEPEPAGVNRRRISWRASGPDHLRLVADALLDR